MRIVLSTISMLLVAQPLVAEVTLSIPLKVGEMDSVATQVYSCGDGQNITVQYVNSGPNALAIMPIDGEDRIFVNVVAASGAKYASGADVWWTKGDTATLENELTGGAALTCQAQDTPPSE